MRHHQSKNLPQCPVCKGHHYPATNGKGESVWCEGKPVEPGRYNAKPKEAYNPAREALQRAVSRGKPVEHVLGEKPETKAGPKHRRKNLADFPPLDSIDRDRIPDTLPDTF